MVLKSAGGMRACPRKIFEAGPSKTSENVNLQNRIFSLSLLNFMLRRRTCSEKVVRASIVNTEFKTQT